MKRTKYGRRNKSNISGADLCVFMFGTASLVGVVLGVVLQYM